MCARELARAVRGRCVEDVDFRVELVQDAFQRLQDERVIVDDENLHGPGAAVS